MIYQAKAELIDKIISIWLPNGPPHLVASQRKELEPFSYKQLELLTMPEAITMLDRLFQRKNAVETISKCKEDG